jgi:transcriptional regulator with XRE-family HTH domain
MKTQEKWLSDLGSRLKDEREKQGLTQQTLAGKANTKQDYIAQLERGSRNPSLRTFMNILSALDISVDYLLYGTSKERTEAMAEVASYYEIVRFMSKYVDTDGD